MELRIEPGRHYVIEFFGTKRTLLAVVWLGPERWLFQKPDSHTQIQLMESSVLREASEHEGRTVSQTPRTGSCSGSTEFDETENCYFLSREPTTRPTRGELAVDESAILALAMAQPEVLELPGVWAWLRKITMRLAVSVSRGRRSAVHSQAAQDGSS